MAYWLLKTEPDCYAWDDLARDKSAVWDGITNALALKHLRSMKKGDLALVYHTGDERAAIGVAEVTSAPYADPKAGDERLVVVDVRTKKKLAQPVTLADIKADPAFAGWDLLRNRAARRRAGAGADVAARPGPGRRGRTAGARAEEGKNMTTSDPSRNLPRSPVTSPAAVPGGRRAPPQAPPTTPRRCTSRARR